MNRPPRLAGSLLAALFLLLAAGVVCEAPPLRLAEGWLLQTTASLRPPVAAPPLVTLMKVSAAEPVTELRRTLQELAEAGATLVLLDLPPATLSSLAKGDAGAGTAENSTHMRPLPSMQGRFVYGLPALSGKGPLPRELESQQIALTLPPFSWESSLRALRNPLRDRQSPGAITVVSTPGDLAGAGVRFGLNWVQGDGSPYRPLLLETGDGWLPTLPLAGLLAHTRSTRSQLSYLEEPGFSGLRLGERRLPTDRQLRAIVPGHPSRVEILSDVPLAASLKGRAVVVAEEQAPLAGSTAETLAALLEGNLLTRPAWASLLEVAVLSYLGLMLVSLVPRTSGVAGLGMMLLFWGSWVAAALTLLVYQGIWLHLLPATILTLAGLALMRLRMREQAAARELDDLTRELGQTLQGQGLLDQALEKFLRCPPREPRTRELLYNLALDFERRRRFGQAVSVYQQLQRNGRYRDVSERLAQLREVDVPQLRSVGGSSESTLVLNGSMSRPKLGRYEIVRELGRGAMGVVFLGRDPKINREVAIKTLAFSDIDDAQLSDVKSRFFREAEAAGNLHHPHIVTIFDAGEEHDLAYMAMEYLQGEPLSSFCSPTALLPPRRALEIVRQVAEALAYAHEQGIVHRDIKPANIMVLASGGIKVTDFGIARVMGSSHTRTGTVLGTPNYMSPEQVAGKKVDGRSDLFSLGVVLYELLSGEKPFEGESLTALMYNILQGNATPLSKRKVKLPKCAQEIVDKLLSKAVTKRYRNAADLVEAIDACLQETR